MEGLGELLNLFASATPAGIFGLMWWLERIERRQIQKDCRGDLEKWLTALQSSTATVGALKDLITAGDRR